MKKTLAFIVAFLPSLALAQTAPIRDVNTLTGTLTSIGNVVIQLLIAFAVIYIIFNVVRYIMSSNDPAKRKEIGAGILYGIVGLFVILSIWGLVAILTGSFGFGANSRPPTEQFPRIQPVTPVTNNGN